MTDELWLALAASFGPILRKAFPGASPRARGAVIEALADEVRKRESWFSPDKNPPAQAMETRRAETACGLGAQHDSAVGTADAPNTQE